MQTLPTLDAHGHLAAAHSLDDLEHSGFVLSMTLSLEEAERELILQALERCGWVQKEAARLLGISSRALNYKIKRFGITHSGWKQNR